MRRAGRKGEETEFGTGVEEEEEDMKKEGEGRREGRQEQEGVSQRKVFPPCST